MLDLQRCKVRTCKQGCHTSQEMIHHREKLQHQLANYTSDSAYRTLLQGDSFVEFAQSSDSFSVAMTRSLLGLYLVPIKINHQTYRFVVDTGAQISSLKSSLIASLQMKKLPGTLSIGSVGGKEVPLAGYLLHELQLGSLTIRHLPVIELSMKELGLRVGKVELSAFDGILGWDILSQLDFELDDVAHQMKVRKNIYRFPYPNMIKASFPIMLVQDGKGNLLTMGFDSGARYGWMSQQAMKQYGYELSEETSAMGFGVHGLEEMKIRLIKEMTLYLDRACITFQGVHTGRTNIFPNISLDGILGNEIFRNRRIRIVNSKEMVLLV